ncbi:MAG: electron transfer flavoprotein subunit alpha/FixB family protein [Eubacteriales bacterium]|jgi:electron transfer flavoprotein alpha subunit
MAHIAIDADKMTLAEKDALIRICPFSAIRHEGDTLTINAGCKMCRLCVKKYPQFVQLVEESVQGVDKSLWQGVAVYAQLTERGVHPVTTELLGKAKELADVIRQPVYAVLPGHPTDAAARECLRYGADRVYVYDDTCLQNFAVDRYTACLEDFITRVKPCALLFGATSPGRSLAPRVAARFRTGLTADCTKLEMRENTDLVQIRPAFGGNIMAQIVTTRTRPQLCTVRYKIFTAQTPDDHPKGVIVPMALPDGARAGDIEVLHVERKPREVDIAEAEVIVAAGRGVKNQRDLAMLEELAEALGGMLAGTRPMIEAGWLDPRRQIGLSGRTVRPKLIITCGVSGSVQFAAGMRASDTIIAINTDPNASIMSLAHVGIVGDLYEIVPALLKKIREGGGLDV